MANVYFAYSTKSNSAIPAPPVRKKARACDACSVRKTRCGEARPCHHCVQNNLECTELRQRKKSGPKSLRSKTITSINSLTESQLLLEPLATGNYSYGAYSPNSPHQHSPDSPHHLAHNPDREPLAFLSAPHLLWLPVPFAVASFAARAALVVEAPYAASAAARFAAASYAFLVAETRLRTEAPLLGSAAAAFLPPPFLLWLPQLPLPLLSLSLVLLPALAGLTLLVLLLGLGPGLALRLSLAGLSRLSGLSGLSLPRPRSLLPLVSAAAARALEASYTSPPDQESHYLLACAELHMYGALALRHPASGTSMPHLHAAIAHAAALAPSFDPRRASELQCALFVCQRHTLLFDPIAGLSAASVPPPNPLPAHVHPVCFAYARMLAALDEDSLLPLLDPLHWLPPAPAEQPHTLGSLKYTAAKAKVDDAFFSGGHTAAQVLRQVLTGRLLLQYAPELAPALLELELLAVIYALNAVLTPRAAAAELRDPLVRSVVVLLSLVPQLLALLRAYLLLVSDTLEPAAVEVLLNFSWSVSMYMGSECKPLLKDLSLHGWFSQLLGPDGGRLLEADSEW